MATTASSARVTATNVPIVAANHKSVKKNPSNLPKTPSNVETVVAVSSSPIAKSGAVDVASATSDASCFTTLLQNYFKDVSEESCREFLNIMRDYTENTCALKETFQRVEELFAGHPRMQIAFNALMPSTKEYRVEYTIPASVNPSALYYNTFEEALEREDTWGLADVAPELSLGDVFLTDIDQRIIPYSRKRSLSPTCHHRRLSVSNNMAFSSTVTTSSFPITLNGWNDIESDNNPFKNSTKRFRSSRIRKSNVKLVHINVKTSQLHQHRKGHLSNREDGGSEIFEEVQEFTESIPAECNVHVEPLQKPSTTVAYGIKNGNSGLLNNILGPTSSPNSISNYSNGTSLVPTKSKKNVKGKEDKRRGRASDSSRHCRPKIDAIPLPDISKLSPELIELKQRIDAAVEKVNATKHRHRKGGPCPRCQVENQLRAAKRTFHKRAQAQSKMISTQKSIDSSSNIASVALSSTSQPVVTTDVFSQSPHLARYNKPQGVHRSENFNESKENIQLNHSHCEKNINFGRASSSASDIHSSDRRFKCVDGGSAGIVEIKVSDIRHDSSNSTISA